MTEQHRPDPAPPTSAEQRFHALNYWWRKAEDAARTNRALNDENERLTAQLRAAEERATFAEQNAERIQRARQRTEEECEVRVRAAEEERDGTRILLQEEHHRANVEREREGRLRALLIEARESCLLPFAAWLDPSDLMDRIDAELFATAAPQPDPGGAEGAAGEGE